jgi:alpha-D-ribose 1-methylphosphonate 5-triphosphate diphosphatase
MISTPGELVLVNAHVVRRHEVVKGSVRAVDGWLAAVDAGACDVPGAIDLEGDWLVPGVVELHTDVLDRHAAPRPGVQWPAAAAVVAHDAQLAGAGITTVLDSLALGYVIDAGTRPRDPRPLVEAIRDGQAAGLLRCEHFLHLRCEVSTEHVLELFEPLAADPLVRLVSLMDHTPGQRQFTSLEKYREYNQGKYGLSDAQIDALIARRHEDQARFGVPHRAAIAARCRERGLTMASHDDATAEHVAEAVAAGTAIAEFPTSLAAAQAARAAGMAVLAGAPNLVLGRSHSGNISAAELAAADLVDILSSDYVPSSALHGAFVLHARHGVPLPAAVAAVTATAARRVGLADRGEIAPGQRADLLRVRLVADLPVVVAAWRGGRQIA